jgi:uncharacterized protein
MMLDDIVLEPDALRAFCQRWQINELSLFGSVLREDFGPDSDIDVLVSFAEDAPWSLMDEVEMVDELEVILDTVGQPSRGAILLHRRLLCACASE